ncbi:Zinc finger, PHD-type [Gossypium australe]|uniref:Zinc finger, PHD-type n=1 Tax=Gossypium australe TaxID=47621 RepID=A0A5B6U8D9_9ROSI|nr:Zinc finger, PHD-type [Gossypium australe]
MEELKNYGHQHPLFMLNEEQLIGNGNGVVDCSRCGEKVSAPCFSCVEGCGFYLHKTCAEAPLELNHPFHRHHPLLLLQNPPYTSGGRRVCDFCDETCEKFIYHCSCGLDFHIKCALFTFNIAERNLKELEHVALEDPSFSSKNDGGNLGKCFTCWEPLAIYTYFSLDCGFNLHKNCAELPLKMDRLCHSKHPLVLQFNSERRACKVCQVTQRRGFVYGCSPCELAIHIDCASPLPVTEDKSHQHTFSLFWRRIPFICDACGTEGRHVAYICGTCSIMVHKKCISLPRIIQHAFHVHRVFHTYFIPKEYFESLNCLWCHEVVDTDLGSYFCADCNVIFHVNCALKRKDLYCIVSQENEDDKSLDIPVNSITKVLERNDAGEATVIEYCKHKHYLMLSDNISEHGDKCCDGCLLLISAKFYHCSRCDFFLHRSCAELPKMKLFSKHYICGETKSFSGPKPLILTSDCMFQCGACNYLSNGFSYKCYECGLQACLRCLDLILQDAVQIPGHKHPLLLYYDYEAQYSACGRDMDGVFQRNPELWFYHCETCDTSAHMDCVLGKYSFIRLGSTYNEGNGHEHPLTFVKKIHYYPECVKCGKPCEDLSLECTEPECKYIVHVKCISQRKQCVVVVKRLLLFDCVFKQCNVFRLKIVRFEL